MINLTKVPIVSRKTVLPSELAGVIREVTDLIKPQVNVIRVFTLDRLSWQLEQLPDHGFLYIVVEQDTPESRYRAAFTMPQKHAVQRIRDLLACKEVQYARVHDAIKRTVSIDADPGAAKSFRMFEALRAELEQHSNATNVLAPETPEDSHSVQESPTVDIYQTESYAPCSLTCTQEREEAMAQLDAQEEASQERDMLIQLDQEIEEETQGARQQQEPAVVFRSTLHLLDSQDQETQDGRPQPEPVVAHSPEVAEGGQASLSSDDTFTRELSQAFNDEYTSSGKLVDDPWQQETQPPTRQCQPVNWHAPVGAD